MTKAMERVRWSCLALVFAIAGTAVGCSVPGTSTSTGSAERTARSRQALATTNGLFQNGLFQNGLTSNGLFQNGLFQNGLFQNGLFQNGLFQNGLFQNGLAQNGLFQNGLFQNGLFQNGLFQNGVWENGLFQNGLFQNGLFQNGLFQNGFVATTLRASPYARELLQYIYACAMPGTLDPITNTLLSDPTMYNATLDPNGLPCTTGDSGAEAGDGGSDGGGDSGAACPEGTICSAQGRCAIPCTPPAGGAATNLCAAGDEADAGDGGADGGTQCPDGYTCSAQGTCVIPLCGSIGLGINSDGTAWWGEAADGTFPDGGSADAASPDGGAGLYGWCDESCQRWVSACVLARTNAYGVHVTISMRAPAPADTPPGHEQQYAAIRNALATSPDVDGGDGGGSEVSIFSIREGAYYGNIFATAPTPLVCSGPSPSCTTPGPLSSTCYTECAPAGPPPALPDGGAYSGPATTPIAATPSLNACAGPDSNIPGLTKRFCSSQGDQVVINVPGICVTRTTDGGVTEMGVCDGIDIDPNGAIHGCNSCAAGGAACVTNSNCCSQNCSDGVCAASSGAAPAGTHYDEVITVYLQQPIVVCGNAVCEEGEPLATNPLCAPGVPLPCYCPSDCHPGTWAKDIAPSIGGTLNQITVDPRLSPLVSLSAVAPDGSVVLVGSAAGDIDLGGGVLSASQGNGVLAKYDSRGTYGWGVRFRLPGNLAPIDGVTIAPSGNITVFGRVLDPQNFEIWAITYGGAASVDGGAPTPLESWSLPVGPVNVVTFAYLSRQLPFDSQGNLVLVGQISAGGNAITIGSFTLSGSGMGFGMFIAKVSPHGAVVWAENLGAGLPLSAVVDSKDNIVIVNGGDPLQKFCSDGSAGVCSDGGAGPCSDGSAAKCFDDSAAWVKSAGIHATYLAAVVDKHDNVYATGYFQSGQDFGAGPINSNGVLPFIVKYGADGSAQGSNYPKASCPFGMQSCPSQYGGLGSVSPVAFLVEGVSIGFDSSNNAILGSVGNPVLGGSIDFGVGPFPMYAKPNIFLSAYSPDLSQVLWAKQIPTILGSSLLSMAVNNDHLFLAGNYAGSMQADDLLLVSPASELGSVDTFVSSFAAPSTADTTPPCIGAVGTCSSVTTTVPSDVFAQATSQCGANVFYMPPTAIDVGNPDAGAPAGVSVACDQRPNTTFKIGQTTVKCIASDPRGNNSSATFRVTVADTQAPVFSPFNDLTLQATSASGAIVTYTPTATDQVDCSTSAAGMPPCTPGADPCITPVCTPASGTTFAIGKTAVTCAATDRAGNRSQMTFVVTVTPPPAPTVTCLGTQGSPVVVSTSRGLCGVTVSNATGVAGTCSGGADGLASCTFDGVSSEILGPGDHTVTVVGTAVGGATATCSSYLRVVDTEKPAVTCANQTTECTGNGGATVTPSATCTDNCSCADSCATTFFAVGTSRGSCTATDPSGNSSSCQASITVIDSKPPRVTPRPGPSTLQCHVDTWSDPGATALDQCVGDLSASVKASGIVDPMHVGSYTETYSVADPSGNVGSATRSVAVVDTLAPLITLNPSPPVLQCGVDSYVEAGAKATDACAGDLTSKISEKGAVKTGAVGTYTLTYSVADPSGNAASSARQVSVVDTLPPTTTATAGPNPPANKYININITSYSITPKGGGPPVTGTANCWTSPGISVALSAVDACSLKQITYALSGAQTGGATVAGGAANVTVSKTGSTTLTYYATDSAGNRETSKQLPILVARSQDGFGFSCAPSPSLQNIPKCGTVTASGTVTWTNPQTRQKYTKPFSFTHAYCASDS
jgi:hypothetical protein